MPISANRERDLLSRYKLQTLYPDSWPHENNSEDSDEEDNRDNGEHTRATTGKRARSGSKLPIASQSGLNQYRTLDRRASVRSNPADVLVQQDEPDPLGMRHSVGQELQRKGLPVQDNVKLRNRFLLSSTSFSPALFISQVHLNASTEDLLRGLDHLSQSIEQKSASLKVLVESNFEKFVKAKATIDSVYTEMRTQGAEPPSPQQSTSSQRPHSRRVSRGSGHFRNASGPFSPRAAQQDKRKNALTKESDFGVLGIKAPLQEVAARVEEVWGPALGGREMEETTRSALMSLEKKKEVFTLSATLHESILKNDYDTVMDAYRQARRCAEEAKQIADTAHTNGTILSDRDVQQVILGARMCHDVSVQIEDFKRQVWKRLKTSHGRKPVAVADESDREEHLELIGALLQLGADENPIWHWLNSKYLHLRNKIARSFERSRIEIEVQRRRLANNEIKDPKALARYLHSVTNTGPFKLTRDGETEMDVPDILRLWDKIHSTFVVLLSSQSGVLGEVIEYWDTVQAFIDNRAQKPFSTPEFAAGHEHLELEPEEVQNLRSGVVELLTIIHQSVSSFFSDAPVENLNDLYSRIPPLSKSAGHAPATSNAANSDRIATSDLGSLPPLSPKRGEAWEKFAFWPPQANSVSGSFYLGKILTLVGTAASEMAAVSVMKQVRAGENLKTLVGAVRERCVQAVCAAWNTDAERCKLLETWSRPTDRKDLTTMPAAFSAFEESVLANTQKIAYISDAITAKGSSEAIVSPPPTKLVQALRGAFVTSLYKALSGMVENAERGRKEESLEADPDGITVPKNTFVSGKPGSGHVDSSNRNIRLLMTLSNIGQLRAELIPQLISQFESAFSVKLTDESKTIRDVLGQIDARLFQSYVRPTVDRLSKIISDGITSTRWEPKTKRPTDAQPYVYDVLLTTVLVHTEVTTTASTMTPQILSYLLEQCSQTLLQTFKTRTAYSLPALMQATLDVEFLAQTLNHYTTDKAGEVQSQIYLALDERTSNDARAGLQAELPGMRATLKRLRENSKGEFGCFRKERGRARNKSSTT